MKINFHYRSSQVWCSLISAERLLNIYRKEYPDIEFSHYEYIFDHHYYDGSEPLTESTKFICHEADCALVIIENDKNKKYFLISYHDRLDQINRAIFQVGGCTEIFACFGVHSGNNVFIDIGEIKYTPIGYYQGSLEMENISQELYKLNLPKIIPPKLHFRSHNIPYLFRRYLSDNDKRFDMRNGEVSGEQHLKEMSMYSINIDINSVAEISHRTADAFALGTALIRPKLIVQFHNKLIPDYHYAAVKCDDLTDFPALADAYIERFEDLKKDPDYVHFLSVNGRKWYEENATIDAHVNILKEVIDFNKLL